MYVWDPGRNVVKAQFLFGATYTVCMTLLKCFMEVHGGPHEVSMEVHGDQWTSMEL